MNELQRTRSRVKAALIINALTQCCPVVPITRDGEIYDYCPLCKVTSTTRPFKHKATCVYTQAIAWMAEQ